jgi:hypothetical protein
MEQGNFNLVWDSSEQRKKRLAAFWDRKVKIRATFDFIPYVAVSPSGSVQHEGISSQNGDQRGGAVTSLWVTSCPVSGPLRDVDDKLWNGETLEFPVFDSLGMLMNSK